MNADTRQETTGSSGRGATGGSKGGVTGSLGRFRTAVSVGVREYSRNPVFLALLVVLPVAFITVSIAVTPATTLPVRTVVDGFAVSQIQTMPEVHGVVMTPITGAFITGLAGLFLMESAANADGRLVLSGYRPWEVIAARLATLTLVAVVVSAVALGVMSLDFTPERFAWFALGVVLVSLLYGLVGMLCGVVLRRLSGMYVMLFAPMMDVGVFQDPMFIRGPPKWWMKLTPGYYPLRMMWDAGFTPAVDTVGSLASAVGYLLVVGALTVAVFARQTRLE